MYLEPEITTQRRIVALKHAKQNAYLLWKVHEWNDCIIYDLAKETVRYRQTRTYKGQLISKCLFGVFCPWFLIRKAIWYVPNCRIYENYVILIYFQAAVSALLAVSVL